VIIPNNILGLKNLRKQFRNSVGQFRGTMFLFDATAKVYHEAMKMAPMSAWLCHSPIRSRTLIFPSVYPAIIQPFSHSVAYLALQTGCNIQLNFLSNSQFGFDFNCPNQPSDKLQSLQAYQTVRLNHNPPLHPLPSF
jgi:hypothetical protein